MAKPKNLDSWVRQQYGAIGLHREGPNKGGFIGKGAFKAMLMELRPGDGEEIGPAIKKAGREGLFEKRPQPEAAVASLSIATKAATTRPQVPVVSSSKITKSVGKANTPPATVKKQSSSALVSKLPSEGSSEFDSVSSSVSTSSIQNTFNGETSHNLRNLQETTVAASNRHPLRSKSVSANLTKTPNPTNGTSNSQLFIMPKQQKYSVFEFGTGGVAVNPSDAYSSAGNPTSSQNIEDLQKFLEATTKQDIGMSTMNEDIATSVTPNLDDQFALLNLRGSDSTNGEAATGDIKNAVLFSAKLLDDCDKSLLPQYGLFGSWEMKEVPDKAADPRIFLNSNIPFSAFICGVQGSGKSHTAACLIENCLIRSPTLGVLQKPLSALVFHYGEATSRMNFKPSEVAFLALSSADFPTHPRVSKVNVLVSPSNYLILNRLYSQIPGVTVQPFKLPPKDLTIGTMLTLMSVDTSESAPLYMSQVTKILREQASKSDRGFDYLDFKRQLNATKLDRKQLEFLNQRLDLLESFLDLKGRIPGPTFEAGTVTIMDLSCPFVDVNTACVLFKIGMEMYLESGPTTGKLIAVDEAHKYMTDTPASAALTESLLTTIRQQRHFGARILISTQEPSISPRLIDLCSMVVIHRFQSPEWFSVLRRHISILDDSSNGGLNGGKELFQKIVGLATGEGLVFAPSAVLGRNGGDEGEWVKLREGLVAVKVRKRVTWDGGRSIVAV